MRPKRYLGAIDNGTTSTRFIVFDVERGHVVAEHYEEYKSLYPQPGWVEQDPELLIGTVWRCVQYGSQKALDAGINLSELGAVGLTNQRETTIAWSRSTGKPLYNAIVWLDTRTEYLVERFSKSDGGRTRWIKSCGLPISTYFSAVKLVWLLENVPAVKEAAAKGDLCVGTVDSWIMHKLLKGKPHVTDVTNASRTMLMNIKSLNWDEKLCAYFGVETSCLPTIKSSAEVLGYIEGGHLDNVPLAGCLGDQQAALLGHRCVNSGQVKSTCGTGCFVLRNTGTDLVYSKHGLLTTVAGQFGPEAPAQYALEGSVAIAGASVNWLRDQLQLIATTSEVNALASSVKNTGGVYFVPAFSGLFAPYWRDDARGTILGLTQHSTRAHIARATLEAVAYQTREVLEAMAADCNSSELKSAAIKIDGGMSESDILMQIHADILGEPVYRPKMHQATAFGAALAAGIGIKMWDGVDSMVAHVDQIGKPKSRPSTPLNSFTATEHDTFYPDPSNNGKLTFKGDVKLSNCRWQCEFYFVVGFN